ncbi:hypothetical protein WME91_30005 [Sorangium sp. So ce269]
MLTRLGPFRLLSRIAKGGMGETFVGERTGAAGVVQRVCVKTLLGQELPDPKWIEDFKNEARLVAPMRHPNIVALYDFDQTMGIWWMALELVEGLDVRALSLFVGPHRKLARSSIDPNQSKSLTITPIAPRHQGSPGGTSAGRRVPPISLVDAPAHSDGFTA